MKLKSLYGLVLIAIIAISGVGISSIYSGTYGDDDDLIEYYTLIDTNIDDLIYRFSVIQSTAY